MKSILKVLCCVLFMLSMSVTASEGESLPKKSAPLLVRPLFIAQPWDGYTNSDGTGLYWEILFSIYNTHNLLFQHEIMQLDVALLEAKAEKLAALIGVVHTGSWESFLDYPSVRLDNNVTSLFFKQGTGYENQDSFINAQVGILSGEQYSRLICEKTDIKKATNLADLATLLIKNKVQYVVASKYEFQDALAQQNVKIEDYQWVDVQFTPLYITFLKNDEGLQLKTWFESGMAILYKNGKLQSLFQKYNTPDSFHFPELEKSL